MTEATNWPINWLFASALLHLQNEQQHLLFLADNKGRYVPQVCLFQRRHKYSLTKPALSTSEAHSGWLIHQACVCRGKTIIMWSHRLNTALQRAGAHWAHSGLKGGPLKVYKYQDPQLEDQWWWLCCHSNQAQGRGEEEYRWRTFMSRDTLVFLRRITHQC